MLLNLPVEAQAPARRWGHDRALVGEALDLARVRGDIKVVAPAGPGDPGALALFAGSGARQARLSQLYRWNLGDSDSAPGSR
jgi:hypothetical protein